MKTTVYAAGKEDFTDIMEFLAPLEFRAITLMSHLCADGKPDFPSGSRAFPGKGIDSLTVLRQNETAGVLLLTSTGILFHCLSDSLDREGAAQPVRDMIARSTVRCILGAGRDTEWLEAFLPRSPYRTVDYHLMTMEAPPAPEACAVAESPAFAGRLRFARALPADAERLLPLQEGYEKEEVIPPGDPFDRGACLANLRSNLGRQIVNYYEAAGIPVAKAGTNARGLAWDQLGGVYTNVKWRGLGLARSLAARTASERIALGRKTALFVKTVNEPAIRAYTSAGFRMSIPFRISYI